MEKEPQIRITVVLSASQKRLLDAAAKDRGVATAAALRMAGLAWAREKEVA